MCTLQPHLCPPPGPHRTPAYAHSGLAGIEGQPHQAGPIDGGNTVPDAEGSRALGRAPVEQVGNDGGGQQGAPAGLNQGNAQALSRPLLDADLGAGLSEGSS